VELQGEGGSVSRFAYVGCEGGRGWNPNAFASVRRGESQIKTGKTLAHSTQLARLNRLKKSEGVHVT